MRIPIIVLIAVSFAVGCQASEGRYVKQLALPDGRVALVAEGDLEPRSIGSYSVRLYGAHNPDFPFDDFQGGVIHKRNGTVEDVKLADVDSNSTIELVVVIRSVGTGGYLSADAFNLVGQEPVLVASVQDLDKNANAIEALQDKILKK